MQSRVFRISAVQVAFLKSPGLILTLSYDVFPNPVCASSLCGSPECSNLGDSCPSARSSPAPALALGLCYHCLVLAAKKRGTKASTVVRLTSVLVEAFWC